jgi:CheY-like chemotaxis protein
MQPTTEMISVRTLLLSRDLQVIETLCHFAQAMGIHIEPCCDVELAMGKLCHAKFEGVFVDLGFQGGLEFLRKVRTLTSNKSVVSYAILGQNHQQADACQAGANFVLDRPLLPGAVLRMLKAAYPLMVQERRRYFRCPLQIAVFVSRGGGTEFTVKSLNVSEAGICLNSAQPMQVGDKLRLRLRLPSNSELLDLSGEVCWSEATGRVGIQFSNVKPGVALTLRTWLTERLEESLQQPTNSPDGPIM